MMKQFFFTLIVFFTLPFSGITQVFKTMESQEVPGADAFRVVYETSKGELWTGSEKWVMRVTKDGWDWQTPQPQFEFSNITGMAEDKAGTLWVSSENHGIACYKDSAWTQYTMAQGLASDFILNLAIDLHGNIWVGSFSGISRFDGKTWTNWSSETDPKVGTSVYCDPAGVVYSAIKGGVSIYRNNTWEVLKAPYDYQTHSIFRDKQNILWLSSQDGLFGYDGKKWSCFSTKNGLENDFIGFITNGHDGKLYLGYYGSGIGIFDGHKAYTVTAATGLCANTIKMITTDSKGTTWIATNQGLCYTPQLP